MADEHTVEDRSERSRDRDGKHDSGHDEKNRVTDDRAEGRDRPPAHADRDQKGPWLGGG